jgi:hypothetical protein
LVRFVASIQRRRSDYRSRSLPIRQADLDALAMIYDVSPEALTERLVRWQVLTADSLILDGEP